MDIDLKMLDGQPEQRFVLWEGIVALRAPTSTQCRTGRIVVCLDSSINTGTLSCRMELRHYDALNLPSWRPPSVDEERHFVPAICADLARAMDSCNIPDWLYEHLEQRKATQQKEAKMFVPPGPFGLG